MLNQLTLRWIYFKVRYHLVYPGSVSTIYFEGGRLETEVQWRGALSISKGGGQKSKGGAAPRYVALDETLGRSNLG